MKLLITGDTHLTDKKPENRTDDYGSTVLRKFEFVLETAGVNECSAILQPMDFFDGPSPSYDFFTKVYLLIEKYKLRIFTGFGQHDQKFRNMDKTGLAALIATCPYVVCKSFRFMPDNIALYKACFGETIPPIIKTKLPEFNILMTHRMIVQQKIWAGQKNYDTGESLLEKHPEFNLIVTGDNHQNFVIEKDDRVLINAGSMMRSTIAQVDFQPKIYIIEIDNNQIVDLIEIDIPIEPADAVFKIENIAREKNRDAQVDAFIDGLSQHKQQDLLFEDDLMAYMKENDFDEKDIAILNEAKTLEAK